jgi:hypothetical protein
MTLPVNHIIFRLKGKVECHEDMWGNRGTASRPGSFTPMEIAPGVHCIEN